MAVIAKKVPFSVNRDDPRSLLDQVTDGLREAIVCGHYAQGDVLPSSNELVPVLGVSRIVTQNALARLTAEGWISSRPGVRSVVRDRGAKQWRGHMLLVTPDGDDNYLQAILSGTLRDRLLDEGWLFSQVCVRRTPDGKFDFSHLDASLSRSVDLVLSIYARPEIIRRLSRLGRPFAVFGEVAERPCGAVGFTRLDYNMAVDDFAKECVRLGVEEVVEVNWFPTMCDLSPLKARGIHVRRVKVAADASDGRLGAVRRAAMEVFARMASPGSSIVTRHSSLRGGGSATPRRVFFFGDDYLATGALTALSFAGLRAPEDFRFATWANRGNELAYPRELSRMEIDPAGAGVAVADSVLAYLKTGAYPSGTVIGPKWIAGETMGTIVPREQSGTIDCTRRKSKMEAAP